MESSLTGATPAGKRKEEEEEEEGENGEEEEEHQQHQHQEAVAKGPSAQEEALILAFYSSRLVLEAIVDRKRAQVGVRGGMRQHRKANSMASLLRRWFVGKQSFDKAVTKTAEVQALLSDRRGIGQHSELVGTAALLELAGSNDPAKNFLVRVVDAPGEPDFVRVMLRVQTRKRGRPRASPRPELPCPHYFVHKSVVDSCRMWASGYESRTRSGAATNLESSKSPVVKTESSQAAANFRSSQPARSGDDEAAGCDGFTSEHDLWLTEGAISLAEPDFQNFWSSHSEGSEPSSDNDTLLAMLADEDSEGLPGSPAGLLSPMGTLPTTDDNLDETVALSAVPAAGWAPAYAATWAGDILTGPWEEELEECTSGTSRSGTKRARQVWASDVETVRPSAKAKAQYWYPSPMDANSMGVGPAVQQQSQRQQQQQHSEQAPRPEPPLLVRTKHPASMGKVMMAGVSFVGLAVLFTSMFAQKEALQGFDGWNCDHPDTSITFGDENRELCASDSSALFPCSFDCPSGSIGVGRTCRCDGCFRDGHCMAWGLLGLGAEEHAGSGCPAEVGKFWKQGGLVHEPSQWPQWRMDRDKVPGISENGGVMWHDTRQNRLMLNLFPGSSWLGYGSCNTTDASPWVFGACPINSSLRDPLGVSIRGVWTHDLTRGSGWHRASEWGENLQQPGPRNYALTFAGAGFFFIFGGFGYSDMEVEPVKGPKSLSQLNDLWVLRNASQYREQHRVVAGSIPAARWVRLSPDVQAGHNTGSAGSVAWPAALQAGSSWGISCNQSLYPGCTGGELWMFGGQGNYDLGPVNTLWQYRYHSPYDTGSWTLITGTPYDLVGFVLGGYGPSGDKSKNWDSSHAKTKAVDECVETWPIANKHEWVSMQQSRCPAARYSAATWPSTSGGGAWMFGGMTPWAANLSDIVTQWRGEGHKKAPPSAYTTVRALSDLWHFNGDSKHPVWRQVHASTGKSSWPPAAAGHGWSSHGQHWLWITSTGREPSCNYIRCYKRAHGRGATTNQLW
eukprot:COSAG02_NODE_278_length_25916_cov_19.826432_1_plen_1015_part_10